MTDIVWGPPIQITDGKKPEWLGDSDIIMDYDPGEPTNGEIGPSLSWHWPAMKAIRLPQDHSYYSSKIDWTGELELIDGTSVKLKELNRFGSYEVWIDGDSESRSYNEDGTHYASRLPSIRNRKKEPTMGKYDDEVVERCVDLARKLANTPFCNTHVEQAEARAIVALLEPVDPDVLEARNLVETAVHWSPQTDRDLASGKNDNTTEMKIALAALKRGRELAMKEMK